MNVYLPKETVPQKLDRSSLQHLSKQIKDKVLYDSLHSKKDNCIIIQDGPPYANGPLHVGHLLNKTLKDVLVKYFLSVEKQNVKFQFGWDCHGLPIEKKALDLPGNLFENAKQIALTNKNIQKESLNMFGIYSNSNDYLTMDDSFKENQLNLYKNLLEQGRIEELNVPTSYSPSLNTVVANSEIEYKTTESSSVYFYCYLDDKKFLVWTTTEWTIPGNQALCLNKDIDYVITPNKLIVSKRYAIEEMKLSKDDLIDLDLNSLTEYVNTEGKTCPILFDDYVTDTNTGIVHLCGGHGDDDFRILKKEGIEPLNVVPKEDLLLHISSYSLDAKHVHLYETITHNVMVDWREKNPVYKVLTNQLYVKLDYDQMKKASKQIKMSSKNREKLNQMLFSRKEWCISRQRTWGVQIPGKEDIFDVWFDSGCVFLLNDTPADYYIEGVDQYRGWFQSSLILASAIDRIPTKQIFSHGFIIDEFNEKLSKSKGNSITLEELYDKYNPDVLRLWIILSNYKNDVIFSEEALQTSAKQYFRIRNFLRYLVNNLYEIRDLSIVNPSNSVKDIIKNLKQTYKDSILDLNYANAYLLIFNTLLNYSSKVLTEDFKNKFYESELTDEFRVSTEVDFQYLAVELSNLLYPLLPFLSLEILNHVKSNQ